MAKNQATLTFAGDTSSLERAFGRVQTSGSKLGHALATLGKAGAVAGFVALAGAAKVGWDEFMQGQKVTAQTAAALKSTGGAAHVTAAQIDELGTSLMNKSGIDDEAIKSGANLLLTFTNVRNEAGKGNDVFNQATAAALDLSVAFGKDMTSSSILVGKALNDPIKGLSALSKVGVSFTASQKEAIKAMVAAGNTAGAQKLILAELTKETGGSAEAFGKTLPGQIEIAKQQFSNLAGELVGKVVPVLLSIVSWVRANWPQISATFKSVFDAVRTAVQIGIDWIRANVVPAVLGIISGVKAAWEKFGPIVMAAFNAVRAIVGPALQTIKAVIETVMALLSGDWGKAWGKLKEAVTHAFEAILAIIRGLVSVFLAAAKALGKAIWDGIVAGLAALAGLASRLVQFIGSAITTGAAWALQKAAGIGQALATGIWDAIKGLGGWLKGKIEGFISGLISSLNPFSPMEHGGALYIGEPLIHGAAAAILAGKSVLSAAINATVAKAVAGSALSNAALAKMGLTVPDAATADPLSPGTLAYAAAQLTPQISDDFAALTTLVTEAEATMAAATKSGSAAKQLAAFGGLQTARSNLAALGPLQLLPDGSIGSLGGMTDTGASSLGGAYVPTTDTSAGSGGTNYTINVTAIDPESASAAVIQAIDDYERRNGQRYARV